MSKQSLTKDAGRVATLSALSMSLAVFAPSSAQAQQALEVFLAGAETHAFDVREAELAREQARSQVDEARARWLPSVSASGGYTRNEVAVDVTIPVSATETRQATITPIDQLDLTLQLNVPIIDVASWLNFASSERSADAASLREESTRLEVQLAVVTAYHQVVATRALRDAAVRSREAASASLERARARLEAQLASDLEVARAESEVARADQQIADAELQVSLGERTLFVLTGVRPTDESASLAPDLSPLAPLAGFASGVDGLPNVRASEADAASASVARDAAWAAFVPVVSGFARERITNAAGFGPSAIWALGLQATFTLDFLRPAQVGTRERALELASLRAERARVDAETRIDEAWHRVQSNLARVRAAESQVAAAERARQVALTRYEANLGTQLDVFIADRDGFTAQAALIQASADLAVARASLRARSEGVVTGGAR